MTEQKKQDNKVMKSSKRNSMGLATALSGLIVSVANMYGIPITLEMASTFTGVILMVISEIKDSGEN